MFVFDPTYAYFSVIVVPNHEIMFRQEKYVSCDEMEITQQESASNTLNAVFINKECCHMYCEATHVCYIEDAREVTHARLMLLEEQG